ncbi:MAG TPA: NADH:flavin oxidoreductase [Gemmataceae bacterium]|nr:NADH:flavin oxidoreductase [Gemmataceae bacterium]
MARYFKFRTRADLEAEAQRLGLDLRFTDDLAPLFRPVKVGPYRVGNSLCIQPMEGCDGTLDGRPDELTFRRYRRFGAGGAKLIWGEATSVVEEGRANPRQLWLTDQTAPDFERLLRDCRQAHRDAFGRDDDLLVGLQLTHSGRYCYQRRLIAFNDYLLDPKTVGPTYPLLEDDYLARLPDYYVAAAKLAQRMGFQFVDIKQCHRYLLSELLAACTRPGPYGGSLENRTRLAREIVTRIRSEVPGLLIATRLNVYDGVPPDNGTRTAQPSNSPVWGARHDDYSIPDMTEPVSWIGEMLKLGVGLVNVSMGNPYAVPHVIRPYEYPPPDGYETPEHPLVGVDRHFRLAEQVQRAFTGVPVVGSGYSYLQEYLFDAGAANIRDERITFLGVGRAALPQPDFAKQLMEHGRLVRNRVCRTFSYCTALMRAKHNELGQFATGCPPFDKEVYGPIWERAKPTGKETKRQGDKETEAY